MFGGIFGGTPQTAARLRRRHRVVRRLQPLLPDRAAARRRARCARSLDRWSGPREEALVTMSQPPVSVPAATSVAREYSIYAGPKEPEQLAAVGAQLDRSIDLGYVVDDAAHARLRVAAEGLLRGDPELRRRDHPAHGHRAALLTAPLAAKQMRSMKRMGEIQPKLKALQEKYKDDRQQQSQEMMKLYKEAGVNPLGGCLPMVLQIPVFIGLYYALQSSIDLRQAPFMLWIDDLSRPETLFTIPGVGWPVRVLPVLMTLSMVLQQRMTPTTTMDPVQARTMHDRDAGHVLLHVLRIPVRTGALLVREQPAGGRAAALPESPGEPPAGASDEQQEIVMYDSSSGSARVRGPRSRRGSREGGWLFRSAPGRTRHRGTRDRLDRRARRPRGRGRLSRARAQPPARGGGGGGSPEPRRWPRRSRPRARAATTTAAAAADAAVGIAAIATAVAGAARRASRARAAREFREPRDGAAAPRRRGRAPASRRSAPRSGELGELGDFVKGLVERMELGPFEITETSENDALVVIQVRGAAAQRLVGGEGRTVDAMQLLANQVSIRISGDDAPARRARRRGRRGPARGLPDARRRARGVARARDRAARSRSRR